MTTGGSNGTFVEMYCRHGVGQVKACQKARSGMGTGTGVNANLKNAGATNVGLATIGARTVAFPLGTCSVIGCGGMRMTDSSGTGQSALPLQPITETVASTSLSFGDPLKARSSTVRNWMEPSLWRQKRHPPGSIH